MSPLHRRGLTLLELVVVLAIIGTVVAILLPAIHSVRASADSTVCQNNLRQIGIAMANYHAMHRVLPPGTSSEKSRYPFLSWQSYTLPYLEANDTWKDIEVAFGKDQNFLRVPPHTYRQKPFRLYACPSDGRVQMLSTRLKSQPIALTSYLGVQGIDYLKRGGALYLDSAVRLLDIRDGTSNTILIGERPPSADEEMGWQYGGWGQLMTGTLDAVLGANEINAFSPQCSAGPYRFGLGSFSNQCDAFHFWSPHRGGAHFLLADSSVRFMSYQGFALISSMATIAGDDSF
ncbi:MAG: DUF1559 domain-containing protein [Gemmataceae bacterium]|nr:DUF1559 domain-containing protein [Gemmataceae bacterium]